MGRRLKVRRVAELRGVYVYLDNNQRVVATGTLTHAKIGQKPFNFYKEIEVVTPYGFMGRSKNLKGTRQEAYAKQMLFDKITKLGYRWKL